MAQRPLTLPLPLRNSPASFPDNRELGAGNMTFKQNGYCQADRPHQTRGRANITSERKVECGGGVGGGGTAMSNVFTLLKDSEAYYKF